MNDDTHVGILVGLVIGFIIGMTAMAMITWSDGINYGRIKHGKIVTQGETFVSYSAVRRYTK